MVIKQEYIHLAWGDISHLRRVIEMVDAGLAIPEYIKLEEMLDEISEWFRERFSPIDVNDDSSALGDDDWGDHVSDTDDSSSYPELHITRVLSDEEVDMSEA